MKRTLVTGMGIVTVCICCLIAPRLSAQDRSFGQKGTVELAGSLSFSSTTTFDRSRNSSPVTVLSLAPEIGYFIADGVELGFSPGVTFAPSFFPGMYPNGATEVNDPSVHTPIGFMQFFATAAYNLRLAGNSSLLPYVEIPFGFTALAGGGKPSTGFSWGLAAGMKIIPADHFLLNTSLQYYQLNYNQPGSTGRNGINYIALGVAVGGFF